MQRFINNILSFFVVLLILCGKHANAQVKVQVVTREISKSIKWEPGLAVWIQADRAEIVCITHASNTIDFKVEFVAKNESRKTAEADLIKMKWVNETSGKKLFLRNYIELERNEPKPESDIKVIYHIKVPDSCAVNINNYFGKIDVENTAYKLTINSEFSKINLQNISGKTTIKTTFGDVSANAIAGDIRIDARRSDIDLSDVVGTLDLHTLIAEINLSGIEDTDEIKIDAEKSKVNISIRDFNDFFFILDLYKSEFRIPERMQLNFSKKDQETVKASFNKAEDRPHIGIKLNIGTLSIEPE